MMNDETSSAGKAEQPTPKKSRWVLIGFLVIVIWLAIAAIRMAMDADRFLR
jgi:flagellar basal body-associated protein FliL